MDGVKVNESEGRRVSPFCVLFFFFLILFFNKITKSFLSYYKGRALALACNLAPVKRGSVSEREPHQYRINKTLNKDTRIMQDNMKKQQKQKQVVANEESKKKERHIVTWTQEVPSFFPLQLVLLFLLLFFYFCLSGLYILLFTYFLLLFYCISSSLGSGVSSLMCVM